MVHLSLFSLPSPFSLLPSLLVSRLVSSRRCDDHWRKEIIHRNLVFRPIVVVIRWSLNLFSYSSQMDLTGRRKNATRETTATLKAWLYEHRKNPYPTKSEKVYLAIITKMTLTQVSTWFANARRRLKKENKMTWSPRNRFDFLLKKNVVFF